MRDVWIVSMRPNKVQREGANSAKPTSVDSDPKPGDPLANKMSHFLQLFLKSKAAGFIVMSLSN